MNARAGQAAVEDYPDATMRYGATARQVADVFEPEGAVDSIVLLLHGGLWRRSDRPRTWRAGRALAEAGNLVATVEYRSGPGQWAAALDDVATAIEQIDLSGREWTAHHAAPRRVTLVGHSSGGQLALAAAARTGAPLTGVLALAPAASLARMSQEGWADGAVEELLGGAPSSARAAYAAADPVGLPPRVPVRILHGDVDTVIPASVSQEYADRHAAAVLEIVPGATHDCWGDPAAAEWQRVVAAVGDLTA